MLVKPCSQVIKEKDGNVGNEYPALLGELRAQARSPGSEEARATLVS